MTTIEPGCRALIIAGDFIGTEVRVLRWIGKPDGYFLYFDCWECTDGIDIFPLTNHILMRIDPENKKRLELTPKPLSFIGPIELFGKKVV